MKKKKDAPMAMIPGGNSAHMLKDFAARLSSMEDRILEAVEQHVAPLRGDRKEIYEEAVANGFDRKALKEVVKKTRLDAEMKMLIDTYEAAVIEDIMG